MGNTVSHIDPLQITRQAIIFENRESLQNFHIETCTLLDPARTYSFWTKSS